MSDLLKLLEKLPDGVRLLSICQRAAEGDPAALDYIKTQGWADALELAHKGAGRAGQRLVSATGEALSVFQGQMTGHVIEAEYRVVDSAPWDEFARWLKAQRWGCFVILGPKGQGKTQLALRLAEIWRERTAYPVAGVNLYPEDIEDLPWVERVGMKSFTAVVKRLTQILGAEEPAEDSDGEDEEDEVKALKPEHLLDVMRRRIVIIDEASLVLYAGGGPNARLTARRAMAQARHLDWLVIYIGQLARQMPVDLLLAEAVFVKKPRGDEARADRESPLVQNLWTDAAESFPEARRSPWWPEFPDERAWSYVDCRDIGNGRHYRGLVPSRLPGAEAICEEGS